MRIIITIIAFAITMGGLFLSGSFHSATTPKSSDLTAAINSPSPSTTYHSKTASILSGIKTFIDFSPAISSPQNSPSATPSLASELTLPFLQRITPTPISSPLHTPTPSSQSRTASTPSPSSQSTPSSTPTPSITPDPTPSPSPSMTDTPIPTPSPSPTSSPQTTATPSTVSESIYIVSTLPLIFKQKGDAQIQIQTYSQASCGITVTWPSGNPSTAKTLIPQTTDTSGFITWTWGVSWNTKTGTGKIDLNCTYDSQPYSKSTDFTVTIP